MSTWSSTLTGMYAVGRVAIAAMCVVSSACVRRPDVASPGAPLPGEPNAPVSRGARVPDLGTIYEQMRLITARGDVPFVGSVARFAGRSPDSTLVLLSLSLANRALTFEREGDRYRAPYEVRIDVRRGETVVRHIASDQLVRVSTFKETARTDESVLFYQYITLPPATYTMSVALRDATSGRSTSIDVPLEVLRLGPDGLSSAVVSYEATPRQTLDTMPRIVARPRATAAFGQDSTVDVFVEGYGEGTTSTLPVRVTVRGERGVTVWSDSSSLGRHGALYAGIVRVPVSRLGIGLLSLDVIARRAAGVPNASDSVRAPLFVSLGEDLPVTTFEDVLGYLRYFASPERLRALREMPLDARGTAWLTFLRETDPSPTTPENEGLRDYFARIRNANLRFVDEGGPGWMTDRGMTYIVLGEPDQIVDPAGQDANARGREQVWEYRQPHERITFEDRSGMGRWRLTSQSATVVQSALRRRQTP